MCGLVGMFGTVESKYANLMDDFLMVCQVRGRDSTGIFKVDLQNKSDWVKQVGTPDFLTQGREYNRRINNKPAKVIAGHCRHSTVGASNLDNAHPFEHGPVVGMHNGTLRTWRTEEGAKDFEVDSDWLMWHISEFGAKETFSLLDADSAYACVWYDRRTNSLQFLRNSKRPLWFTWSEDLKTVFYASEIWMFGAIQRDRAVKFWDGGEDGQKYVELPEDTLWSFQIDYSPAKDKKSLNMAPIEIIKQKEKVTHANFTRTNHGMTGTSGRNAYRNPASNYNHVRNPDTGVWEPENVKGGEVTDPFREASKTQDDDIGDIGKPNELKKKGLPKLGERLKRGLTQIVEESTTTSGTSNKSKKSSSTVSDFRLGMKPSKNVKRPRLSLVPKTSETSLLDNNGNISEKLRKYTETPVSFRVVAGEQYVTCNRTGREFSEKGIENISNGCCSFCDRPIGDLKEIAEFASPHQFICISCATPSEKFA